MKKEGLARWPKLPRVSSNIKLVILLAATVLLVAAVLFGLLGGATVESRLENMMMRVLTVPNGDLAALFEPYDSVDEALTVVTQQEMQLALAGALGDFADAELLKQPVIAYEVLGVHVMALVHDYTILPKSVTVKQLDLPSQYDFEATVVLNMDGVEDEPLTLSGRIFINAKEHVLYLGMGMSVQDLIAYYPQ